MTCIYIEEYDLEEVAPLDIYFNNDNFIVQTNTDTDGMLTLRIEVNIDDEYTTAIYDIARIARPSILIVQGIISFLLDYPVTVYEIVNTKTSRSALPIFKETSSVFKVNGKDLTNELEQILEKISNRKTKYVAISLLDRWRKSLLLENEDDADVLYKDEALLGLFHILEILSNEYSEDLKDEADIKISEFLNRYGHTVMIGERDIERFEKENRNAVKKLLYGGGFTFATRVKFLLSKYDINSEREMDFVDDLIKIRNRIAHGRKTFKNSIGSMFTPFFNNSEGSENEYLLKLLVKKLLGNFFGIDAYNNEYSKQSKELLLPRVQVVKEFLNKPEEFDIKSVEDLNSNAENEFGISWINIYQVYLKNSSKIKLDMMTVKLKVFFSCVQIDDENWRDILCISLIFCESQCADVMEQSKKNIQKILDSKYISTSDLMDENVELESSGIKCDNLKAYILLINHKHSNNGKV
ncbi:hypothetical protein [Latilactobacillus fuchuensis]|uniref:hypothetical protein n=1 Tax=Latilactobacillus fuchuensis TaxID=164393 RepID=UPI0039AEE6DA